MRVSKNKLLMILLLILLALVSIASVSAETVDNTINSDISDSLINNSSVLNNTVLNNDLNESNGNISLEANLFSFILNKPSITLIQNENNLYLNNIPEDLANDIYLSLEGSTLDEVYVADNGLDSNDGSKDHPFKTLAHALDVVKTNGKIIFIGENIISNQVISKNITLTGINGILKGNNSRILNITGGVTVTITNLTLKEGCVSDDGGAIYSDGTLIIGDNVSFRDNIANKGGAIYNYGGSLCISGVNTSFINNNAIMSGGAIYSHIGNVTINGTDTKFRGNFANGGGAIYNYVGSLCISGFNTSFINNNATSFGGAIYVDTSSSLIASLCISGVNTIFRCNAAGSGGAIYSNNGNVTINGNDTKFISNSATDTKGVGGAIYTTNNGSLCISGVNTSFIDNHANNSTNSFGGAICTDSGIMYISGVNTSFTGNRACYGGAIYVSGDNYTIEGSIFINNNASYDVYAGERGGGAIYIAGNYTTLKNCTFINNTALGLGIETSYHGTDGGSAVLVLGNNNTIDSCIFINNTVFSANGNYTGDEGGAVFVCANYTTLKNCTFNNNDAPCAGAVFVCGNYTIIEWCNFTNNVAVGNGTFDGGGAIYLYTSSSTGLSNCTIVNCNFINNYVNGSTNSGGTKTTDAGAIYSNMDYVTISYSYFEGNFAQKGGAIRMHGSGDYPIHHCSFTGNRAVERGGAVYLADSIFRNLTDCNFTNNSVIGSDSFGGAINIQLGMINNCNFINNSARYRGGAIMWDHTYAATKDGGFANNCTFVQNTAHQGSAIYFDNVVNSITLTNVSFINNTADSDHINIDCNQSEDSYTFTITHYGFNNILDAIYFKCSDSTTKNITINNVTYSPSNENALRTDVITNVTFICFEGIETLRIDSGHPYVLNTSNSSYKHPIKVIATYDGPLYTYVSNSISFNYETEIIIGDFSGLTLSNVTSTVNIHIKGDSNATINNTKVNVTLSFEDRSRPAPYYYYYSDVDVIDGKMTLPLPTLKLTDNVTANLKIEFNGNSTYNASANTTTLLISKRETTMNVSVISDHGNFVFDVKLPENATGKVYIFGYHYHIDNNSANLTADGIAHFNITTLTPGNYESYFKYDGDDYFKSHNQDFNFTIYGDYSFIEANVSSYNLSLGDNLTVNGTVYGNSSSIPTGNVTIILSNGETYTSNLTGGKFNITISNLNSGNYSVNITYNGDSKYCESSTNITDIIVNKGNVTVNIVTPESIVVGENVTIRGNVTGTGTFAPTGNVTIYLDDGQNITVDLNNGSFNASFAGLNFGNHSVLVSYNGDSNYYNVTANASFIVKNKGNFTLSIPDNLTYGNRSIITVYFSDNVTGNVTLIIDEGTHKIAVVRNGSADFELPVDLSAGNHTLRFIYNGDKYNNSTSQIVNVTVNKAFSTISVPSIYVGDKVTIILSSDATGNVTVIYNDTSYNAVVGSNGRAVVNIPNLAEGNYTLTVKYSGDNNYLNCTWDNVNLTVKKKIIPPKKTPVMIIDAQVIVTGEDALITVKLPADATGNVVISLNGESYTVKLVNGACNLTVSGLTPGSYNVNAVYSGDNSYYNVSGNATLVVKDTDIVLSGSDVEKYYGGNEAYVVRLTKDGEPLAGEVVTIVIIGVSYNRTTDNDGLASLSINLGAGVYTVSASYADYVVNNTVTVKSTVHGDDFVKYYLNGTQYEAYVTDSKGNPLDNVNITFNILGVFYTRTAHNGVVKLNINLWPGEYIITVYNDVTGEASSNNVKVLPTIESSNLVKYYRNDSQFVVRLLNGDGSSVGAGETVTFNINGVYYTRTTDDGGYASLNINLNPGDYIITASYGVCSVSNNITVLPVLTGSDLNMTYLDGSKYECKLVDGRGTPVKGAEVTLNIVGVFYHKITDDEGIARLTINLLPGEYIITAIYNGTMSSNKITVRDSII